MIVTAKCPHCDWEFDAEAEERAAKCPACDRSVILKTPKVILPKQNAAPISRMISCADCAATMSRRALWCQQCGSLQRSLFSLVWSIMCQVWLVNLIVAILAWVTWKVIGMIINP